MGPEVSRSVEAWSCCVGQRRSAPCKKCRGQCRPRSHDDRLGGCAMHQEYRWVRFAFGRHICTQQLPVFAYLPQLVVPEDSAARPAEQSGDLRLKVSRHTEFEAACGSCRNMPLHHTTERHLVLADVHLTRGVEDRLPGQVDNLSQPLQKAPMLSRASLSVFAAASRFQRRRDQRFAILHTGCMEPQPDLLHFEASDLQLHAKPCFLVTFLAVLGLHCLHLHSPLARRASCALGYGGLPAELA
mmetsp:Transcript_82432/g.229722  ORF Transcript_82432/g.229722 Transcript_82432/m.229722 type:complete len:243 (+) Transcript_82432:785-1513(+)